MSMVKNMFSMFDPSSSLPTMSWAMIIFLVLLLSKNEAPLVSSNKGIITMALLKLMEKEINQLLMKKMKNSKEILSIMFLMTLTMNLIAILPWNFTLTAHISITLSISLSMWASIILYSWINKFKHMVTHLTPMGTPSMLMNFMVIIETVSNIIRPITLSIRLSANMVAGHLLMSLLSSMSMTSTNKMFLSFVPMVLLSLLELAVASIQAYVLTTLIMLYQNEMH